MVEMMGVEPMSEIRSNRLLRVQTVDELFPFPRSPLSGVGSGSFINLCHGFPSKLWKEDISFNLSGARSELYVHPAYRSAGAR